MIQATPKNRLFCFMPQVISFLLLCSLLLGGCSGQHSPMQTEAPTATEQTPLPTDQPLYLTLGGMANATIIRPAETTDAVLNAVLDLRDEIERLGGVSLSVKEDLDYHAYDHTDATELIVGYTKSPRSAALMKNLRYGEYAVVTEENKIYVLAHHEESLLQALSALRTQLLCTVTTPDGKNAVTLTGGLRCTSDTLVGWLESGSFSLSDCVIVYPRNSTGLKDAALRIAYILRQLFSTTVEAVPDSVSPHAHEIRLGKVSRPAPSTPISHSPLRANFQIIDGSLWIGAKTDADINEAILLFAEQLRTMALFSPVFELPADYHATPLLYNGSPISLTRTANTRIMSFNLLAEEWADPTPTTGRDVAAAATLLAYRPDVVGLQEVDEFWDHSLTELIADDGYRFAYRDTNGNGTGAPLFTTLLYNSNTVRLLEGGQRCYSDDGSRAELRTAVWGVFERIDTGSRFIVLSTHWDLPAQGSQRAVQAAKMAALTQELAQKYQIPILCTGDFNTVQSDGQYRLFLNRSGFSDAAYTAAKTGLICRTIHPLGNSPTLSDPECYDHIFHSPNISVLYYTTVIDTTALNASDHAPVFADFRL